MIKFRRTLRASALAVALIGCSQPQPPEPAADGSAVTVAIAPPVVEVPPVAVPEATPVRAAQPPKPEPPPPTFAFPADQGGAAVAKVVTPNVARPLAAEKVAVAPKPRAVPAKVLEPDSAPAVGHALPPLLPSKPVSPKPANPAERVPFDLGARADGLPAKPVLPVAAIATERARDVNLPPPAPGLGRPLVERVGLDDPTSELGNTAAVSGTLRVSPAVSGFVRVSVPDPFELGEQVKPKVPTTAEPLVVPVTVNPARVK